MCVLHIGPVTDRFSPLASHHPPSPAPINDLSNDCACRSAGAPICQPWPNVAPRGSGSPCCVWSRSPCIYQPHTVWPGPKTRWYTSAPCCSWLTPDTDFLFIIYAYKIPAWWSCEWTHRFSCHLSFNILLCNSPECPFICSPSLCVYPSTPAPPPPPPLPRFTRQPSHPSSSVC